MEKMIAVNAGSSSLKWKLFEMPEEKVIASGNVARIGLKDSIVGIKYGDGQKYEAIKDMPDHESALNEVFTQIKKLHIIENLEEIVAAGHRVVAGGEDFKASTIVGSDEVAKIEALAEFAPLHNPSEAKVIRIFEKLLPNTKNVAVFDTSFHQTMPDENYLYSIPYEYYEKYRARRYGAHGTSHKYVSQRYLDIVGRPEHSKIITCHLGNGASLTAIEDGKSIDTSMGFTPLAGITMGTRSGDIDASLIPYLMEKEGITNVNDFINILNTKSGVLGLSGISSDMCDLRDARAEGDERADLALRIYANRVVKYIGSYVATLNGCDAIVFTGGVGENAPEVREEICQQLTWLGINLDETKNNEIFRGKEGDIATKDSKVRVYVIPTDEELMIVRDTQRLIK